MQSREDDCLLPVFRFFTQFTHSGFGLFIISVIVANIPSCFSLFTRSSGHLFVLCQFQIMYLDVLHTSTAYVRGTACTPLHVGTGP